MASELNCLILSAGYQHIL